MYNKHEIGETSDLPRLGRAQSIRSARKAAGLTQAALAEKAGVNIRQIQKVESGEAAPGNMTARNLLSIADALGVDVRDLIG